MKPRTFVIVGLAIATVTLVAFHYFGYKQKQAKQLKQDPRVVKVVEALLRHDARLKNWQQELSTNYYGKTVTHIWAELDSGRRQYKFHYVDAPPGFPDLWIKYTDSEGDKEYILTDAGLSGKVIDGSIWYPDGHVENRFWDGHSPYHGEVDCSGPGRGCDTGVINEEYRSFWYDLYQKGVLNDLLQALALDKEL